MRRREFITLLGGAAAAWPFDAHAQGLVPIVGFASSGSRANQDPIAGFEAGLKEMGFVQVKPYVKRHKNDATDAEAICEAVTRPNMRFVAIKTPEQQSCLTLHRTRHLFIRLQTMVINAIRAHLAEFGIVAPVGRNGVEQLLSVAADSRSPAKIF
jgi:transposase